MITLWRIFKTGFRNIFRNAWLSTAATAIMVVTLLVVTFFGFSAIFVNNQLAEVKSKIDLSLFISDEATQDNIKELQAKLIAHPDVKSVEYVSKEDALAKLAASSADGQKLAESAKEIGNPLPASFEVKVKDLDNIQQSNVSIKKLDEAKIISESSLDKRDENRQGIVENIIKISSGVARVGAVLSFMFLGIALLVIFNTIRMAIFTRREEIEIMRLVGATNWFIRGPFIVEGSLYGVFGGSVALLLLIPISRAIGPFITQRLNAGAAIDYFTTHFGLAVIMIYGLGIFIGAVSSWFAISRYLRLK
jgi:cell division transport system permease protein